MIELLSGNTLSLRNFTATLRHGATTGKILEEPRILPATGFSFIDCEQRVEEKELPDYKADWFYAGDLGKIFQGRYQTLAKFGFGS
ncbi:hypothetical protein BJX65DRAFT_284268 [Aspergillus insuetus]